MPPDMSKPSAGCSFAPRCEHATDLCTSEPPTLQDIGQAHTTACLRVQRENLKP
jgi:oligopeptide/dipeptide ABC transporter ATP-binding protein